MKQEEKVIAKAGIISIVYRFEGDLMLADPVTPIKQYQNLTEELVTTEKQLSLKSFSFTYIRILRTTNYFRKRHHFSLDTKSCWYLGKHSRRRESQKCIIRPYF